MSRSSYASCGTSFTGYDARETMAFPHNQSVVSLSSLNQSMTSRWLSFFLLLFTFASAKMKEIL